MVPLEHLVLALAIERMEITLPTSVLEVKRKSMELSSNWLFSSHCEV